MNCIRTGLGARSFFQAGGVKPAHENDYGTAWTADVGGAALTAEGSQQKLRGSVNGTFAPRR
jgi:hypothetical protein